MPRILLQAGHWPSEPGAGGAPGEAQWNSDCAEKVAAILREQGVEVAIIGTFLNALTGEAFPPAEMGQDWDSFWALHYNGSAKADDSGCCAARWQFETRANQADALVALWRERYTARTGLAWREDEIGNRMLQYYAFQYLSWQTPGVILEHGFGWQGDKALLHDHIDFIAALDAAIILESLGMPAAYPEDPRVPAEGEEHPDFKLTTEETDAFLTLKGLGWATREILEEKVALIGALEAQVPTEDQRAILDTMAGLNANATSISAWISEIGALQERVAVQVAEISALKAQGASLPNGMTLAATDTKKSPGKAGAAKRGAQSKGKGGVK